MHSPISSRIVQAIPSYILALLKEVCLFHIRADMLSVEIEDLLRVCSCQKPPVFRAFTRKRYARNLIRSRVACYTPLTVFVLGVTANVSSPPSLLIANRRDFYYAGEGSPCDVLLDRIVRRCGFQWIEELQARTVVR